MSRTRSHPSISPARPRHRAVSPPRLALLLEIALVGLLLLVNITRYEQGPILMELGHEHGIHLADALLATLILATLITVAHQKPKT
jgi:hypothetical protein